MSKWGVLKQARQRASRMEAAGIFTSASENFRQSLKLIDLNKGLTRAEKTALKEEAAKTYLESGYSTKAEIHETFESLTGQYMEEITDPKLEAEFLGMMDEEKAVVMARHYLGSETVQYVADAVGDDSKAFYEIISTVVTEHWTHPEPDAITSLINQMVEALE